MGVLQAAQVKQCTCQVIFRACMISWKEATVTWQLSPLLSGVRVDVMPANPSSLSLPRGLPVMPTMPLTCLVQSLAPNLHIPNPLLPQLSPSVFGNSIPPSAQAKFPFSHTPHQVHQEILLGPSSRRTQILTTSHSLPDLGCEPQTSLAR